MSAVASRPFLLASSSRQQKIADYLTTLANPLAKRWLTTGSIDVVAVSALEDIVEPPSHIQYLVQHAEGWVALHASRDDWKKLAQQFLGCSVGSLTTLVRSVLSRFAVDCHQAICASSANPSIATDIKWSELPAVTLSRGSGVISAQLRIHDVLLSIIVPPEVWPALFIQEIRSPQSGLASAKQALAHCTIELEVRLPSVQMPLPKIGHLAVGDFLNLGQNLDGSVKITGKKVDLSFEGKLGQSCDRKAVQINRTLTEVKS